MIEVFSLRLKELNAKVKFFYLLILLTITLSSKSLPFIITVIGTHLLLLPLMKIPLREILKALFEPLFIAVVIFLIKTIKITYPYFDLTELMSSAKISLRIIGSSLLLVIFLKITPITQVLALLNWLRVPLLLQELIYLTFRFVKLWHDEIQTIYLSQKNRLGYRGFINSLRSLHYLIQGAFFQALDRAEVSLQAMYQRGYDYRNLLSVLPSLSPHEIHFLILTCLTWIILCFLL